MASNNNPKVHNAGLLKQKHFGWVIQDNGPSFHPVTGRFMAFRHGVRIGANTYELLIRMIDAREDEK